MSKIEGSYYCYNNGYIVTQCSIWDILNDRECEQIKKLIRKISKRNRSNVTITISVEGEN